MYFQNTAGAVLSVPMPGHRVGESMLEQVQRDVITLEKLVETHDALFLLMDSRESRWLPTLLGAAHNKVTSIVYSDEPDSTVISVNTHNQYHSYIQSES